MICLATVAAVFATLIMLEMQQSNFVWVEYRGKQGKGGWLGDIALEMRASKPWFISLEKAGVEVLTEEGWVVHSEVWHGEERNLADPEEAILWVEEPRWTVWRGYVNYNVGRPQTFLERVEEAWKNKDLKAISSARAIRYETGGRVVTPAIEDGRGIFVKAPKKW